MSLPSSDFTRPLTEGEREELGRNVRRQVQPGGVQLQFFSLCVLALSVAMCVGLEMPLRHDLPWIFAVLGLGPLAALYLAMRGRNEFQFVCSGFLQGISTALAFRFLVSEFPNPAFWQLPIAMLLTFAAAIAFASFRHHLAYNLLCWLILTDAGTIGSGVPEQRPLVVLLVAAGMVLASGICLISDRARRRNVLLSIRLKQQADYDGLTRLRNRRAFMQIVETAIHQRADSAPVTTAAPPCFVLIDIDDFKQINDTRGHDTGDAVLQDIAEAIARQSGSHPCGRLGGEEFGILLAGPGAGQPAAFMDELLPQVQSSYAGGPTVTISAGLSVLRAGDTLADFVRRADLALYEAKRSGKNRWSSQDLGSQPA